MLAISILLVSFELMMETDAGRSIYGESLEKGGESERKTFTLHQGAHGISCQMRGRAPRYCITGPIHLTKMVRD